MKLHLKHDPFTRDLLVTYLDPTGTLQEQSLKAFYIAARKASGMTIGRVETLCGLEHPTLRSIELSKKRNPTRPMLIALLELGYSIELSKNPS